MIPAAGDWLPEGKSCAICFSVDDVHPAGSADGFDAGGDMAEGALGHLLRLIDKHPQLRTTLCVTPDWRPRTPYATRCGADRSRSYLAERWPAGKMRLDRHPAFVAFVKSIPGAEFVPHGLHHIQRGENGPAEFERASEAACAAILAKAALIFDAAGLTAAPGHSPPGWCAPEALQRAMREAKLLFVASARDIRTPISRTSLTDMSGLSGMPLIFPCTTAHGLVHIPANFQATSDIERALTILGAGGLLSIKAHVAKRVGSYVALDGLDSEYCAYLDRVLARCTASFGDTIWWASMSEIAQRYATARLSRGHAAAS